MRDNGLSIQGFCSPYVLGLCLLLSASRAFFSGFDVFPGDLVITLSFGLLAYSVDRAKGSSKRNGIRFLLLSAGACFCGTFYLSFLNTEPSFPENLLAGVALSFPVVLSFPILGKTFGKKILGSVATLCSAAVIYAAVRSYIYSYTFLYLDVADIRNHTAVFNFLFALVVLTAVLECVFQKGRNFLGYTLLGIGVIASLLEPFFRLDLSVSGKNMGLCFVDRWFSMTFFLYLIIYIKAEQPEKRNFERRNVVFSNMVYQEVKPIKRRKKSPKFEVPPNVPVFKNYVEEVKIDEKTK